MVPSSELVSLPEVSLNPALHALPMTAMSLRACKTLHGSIQQDLVPPLPCNGRKTCTNHVKGGLLVQA